MKTVFYYEELPLAQVAEVEALMEKRLHDLELTRALHCDVGPVYHPITMKDGSKYYIVRGEKYDGSHGRYIYKVQFVDNDLNVLESAEYTKEGDECKRLDGYPIRPLFMLAVKALRIGRQIERRTQA